MEEHKTALRQEDSDDIGDQLDSEAEIEEPESDELEENERCDGSQDQEERWQEKYVYRPAEIPDDEPIARGSVAEDQPRKRLPKRYYEKELKRLQVELVKLQEWIRATGLRVVVLFEGRDAAGKGGVIKRITARLNPRICRVVALPAPSDREKTQWYFQRYVPHLPAAGEMVLFDRSWYNRAGVERVMGFCTEQEFRYFIRNAPVFERMLVEDGIRVLKYWISVSDREQEYRFQERLRRADKRWKLSPMDLQSRARWEEYTKAKDYMHALTDIPEAPWWVVKADDKRRARLDCIRHLLTQFDYEDVTARDLELPERQKHTNYRRRPVPEDKIVPENYRDPPR